MSRHGAYYQDVTLFSSHYFDKEKFSKLFPDLPSFATNTPQLRTALRDIGKKDGIMDANDDLTLPPQDHITNLAVQVQNLNSPVMTAGILP